MPFLICSCASVDSFILSLNEWQTEPVHAAFEEKMTAFNQALDNSDQESAERLLTEAGWQCDYLYKFYNDTSPTAQAHFLPLVRKMRLELRNARTRLNQIADYGPEPTVDDVRRILSEYQAKFTIADNRITPTTIIDPDIKKVFAITSDTKEPFYGWEYRTQDTVTVRISKNASMVFNRSRLR